ncbi:carbohydrate kinase [Ameyamaea chiangmaiensis NBRC 103196]|uniref:Carbohydrate kinase n=1 Tax=Ameyamaea chiangmaiensis TaxID=442969 RepID=A0A850PB68_9PROT|nr:FGGY-family carbohydrate kinase [Ameyamaea chiangmaiensis]MBS4075934.1 carbohydrate kinase [Ameyamaea chiangmaiensis]NVN40183.1 carbohydrate kinase [Ameyamaea chiangmaiensis]GBQ61684.1 carbohydrate kinase [Ameyamaea chiangmaiensis NBRC 103196]
MPNHYVLGIDCGSTTAKTVVFDPHGRPVGIGKTRVGQITDRPYHVERDMAEAWHAIAKTVRLALDDAGIDGRSIAGVGITAHGDGVFVLDRAGAPLGHGIMSLDSRARQVHADWAADGTLEKLMPLSGQRPYPYSAPTLLAWMRDHEPERYQAIGTVFFCKDWLRLCLTGTIATDLTEASSGFTDLHTQDYSTDILDVTGLAEIRPALPPILMPCDQAGTISASAAALTGLLAGTPVATGLHDVTAAAVGLGNIHAGDMTITAGTFSINEIFCDTPVWGTEWACRAGYRRGLWNSMAISPTSSTNLEWLARLCWPDNDDAVSAMLAELATALKRSDATHRVPLYHPFLFGAPVDGPSSAAFFGMHGWHTRADLARSVLEGMICNHRLHVDALAANWTVGRLGIAGGGSGEPAVAQRFADILGRSVHIANQPAAGALETGALAAAMTGAVACGLHPDLETAVSACNLTARTYAPDTAQSARDEALYSRFLGLMKAVEPFWADLEPASETPPANLSLPLAPVADVSRMDMAS